MRAVGVMRVLLLAKDSSLGPSHLEEQYCQHKRLCLATAMCCWEEWKGREAREENALGLRQVRRLPLLDLLPGALVDGVVDGDDSLHVGGARVVALALHGLEEHLLGRVHPVARGVDARLDFGVGRIG